MLAASLGPFLSSRVFAGHFFFPSSLNPADDPTRHLSVRGPSAAKPSWWTALEDGDPSQLEAFLLEREDPAASSFKQTDLFELGGSRPVVLQSNRERERLQPHSRLQRARLARSPRERALTLPNCQTAGSSASDAPPGSVLDPAVVDLLALFPARQFVTRSGRALDLRLPGALDLFDSDLGVARALARHGAPWVLTFNSARSPDEDLANPELRSLLEWLLSCKAFKVFRAKPPASFFLQGCSPPSQVSNVSGWAWAPFAHDVPQGPCRQPFESVAPPLPRPRF